MRVWFAAQQLLVPLKMLSCPIPNKPAWQSQTERAKPTGHISSNPSPTPSNPSNPLQPPPAPSPPTRYDTDARSPAAGLLARGEVPVPDGGQGDHGEVERVHPGVALPDHPGPAAVLHAAGGEEEEGIW